MTSWGKDTFAAPGTWSGSDTLAAPGTFWGKDTFATRRTCRRTGTPVTRRSRGRTRSAAAQPAQLSDLCRLQPRGRREAAAGGQVLPPSGEWEGSAPEPRPARLEATGGQRTGGKMRGKTAQVWGGLKWGLSSVNGPCTSQVTSDAMSGNRSVTQRVMSLRHCTQTPSPTLQLTACCLRTK